MVPVTQWPVPSLRSVVVKVTTVPSVTGWSSRSNTVAVMVEVETASARTLGDSLSPSPWPPSLAHHCVGAIRPSPAWAAQRHVATPPGQAPRPPQLRLSSPVSSPAGLLPRSAQAQPTVRSSPSFLLPLSVDSRSSEEDVALYPSLSANGSGERPSWAHSIIPSLRREVGQDAIVGGVRPNLPHSLLHGLLNGERFGGQGLQQKQDRPVIVG